MHFLHTLSFVASLAWTACAEGSELEERAAPKPQCAITGSRFLPPYYSSKQASLTDAGQCGALCKGSWLCQSYAVGNGACNLYILPTFLDKKSSTGPYTFYDRGCATNADLCMVNGVSTTRPIKDSNAFLDNSWTGCSALCKKTANCKSYSLGSSSCRLYGSISSQGMVLDSRSNIVFWDIKCPLAIVNPPVPRPTASNVPEVKFTETPQIVTVPAPYTPLVTDSPPYTPTGPQPPHGGYANDDDLTDSYSFAPGYDMPTLAAMGSDPVTTGIPQPTYDPAPCMISTGPQAQFTILDSNFVPLISKASNQLGPIAQPTVQPSASDPLSKVNPQDITFPGFYLQQAAGGPANTYDLIYAGSTTQYVAMMSNGKIVLTGSSTGPNYINGLATTIFSTDCNGKLTISQGGQAYSWSSINGLTKAAAGGSAHMVALPKNHPAITKAKRDREENLVIARGLQEKLKRRQKLKRNEYQEGDAPKCPNNIPNLVPYLRSDYTLGEGNVCDNLPDWWQLSPFDFDKSCAVQSLCFDQCQHFGWDSCTGIFTVLAISSCAEHFSGSWWDIIPLVACTAQATYYSVYAGTRPGKDLFFKAQKAMCVCYCGSPPDTCIYPNKSFYCADLKGSDDNNCGNCGRQCGPNTKCKKGQCACPGDQCGKTCLDFKNNPDNCGSCGNSCNPRYCVDGRCYVPQPGECTPDPPIQNGDFTATPWLQNWETGELPNQPSCTFGDNVKVGTAYDNGNDHVVSPQFINLPSTGCAATVIQRKVKLCPTYNYKLKFNARYVSGLTVSAGTFTGTAKCKVSWVLGTDVSPTNFSPYQSHTWDISDSRYQTYDGWTFNVHKGDAGLTKKSENFFVDLTMVVYCTPQKENDGAALSISGIVIEQYGKAS